MTTPEVSDGSEPSVRETHISTVFFADDRAYKLLKPLRTSFLDHSTVEKRLAAVDQEIELNRRMASDVYLGSADVVENGELVDRMLVMRRLPASRRLTRLIGTEAFGDCVRAVARTVATFHAAQPPLIDAVAIAGRDAVRKNWHDNFADMAALTGEVLDPASVERVEQLVDHYLDHREVLLQDRIANGFVRDGHGDLTAEDIFCLPDGPRVLDCLAFDPKLRISDVLADVAFLAMDLDRLAGPQCSQDFIRWYCEFSNEHHPASLAHHYVAYRAHVRAKVAGLRHRQGDTDAADLVRQYHDLCQRHLERANLTVILVGGTPGTGKTTLSRALSEALGSMLLSTDELRKDLAGQDHLQHDISAPDEGIYAPDMSERTYAALLDRAAQLLDRAESVVLDASWNQAAHRQAALTLAAEKGAEVIEIVCVLDPEIAKRRIADRLRAGDDPSDARPEIVDELQERQESWPSAVRIDTEGTPERVLAVALERVPPR